MSTFVQGPDKYILPFEITQTDLLAGTAKSIQCPFTGVIDAIGICIQTAVTTGGTLTLEAGGVTFNTEGGLDTTSFPNAIQGDTEIASGTQGTTAVAGCQVTVANGAAKGTMYVASSTDLTTSLCIAGGLLNILPASFATAGAVTGWIRFRDR